MHYRPIDALLSRLEGVKRAGADRWSARCPAHEDSSPSLSLRDTGEKVLIHCHAGCDPETVLRAVGLAWADLYPDPEQCAYRRPNELARARAKRFFASRPWPDFDHERMILKIAAAAIRAGKTLSAEDVARVQIARERIATARGRAA